MFHTVVYGLMEIIVFSQIEFSTRFYVSITVENVINRPGGFTLTKTL